MRQKEAMEIVIALHLRGYEDAEAIPQPSGQWCVRFTRHRAEGRRVLSSLHDLVTLFPKKAREASSEP